MSKRREIISPEGLRQDGRRPHEMRDISAQFGILAHADGSAIFELGNTKVIATVHGPHESHLKSNSNNPAMTSGTGGSFTENGRIVVTFHQASFSSVGGERKKSTNIRQDRRLNEWSRFVQETFESVVITSTFPRSQLDIFIKVINADGGVLAAAINAVTLALIDGGIPMTDYVLATSSSHVQNQEIIDLNRIEEGGGMANLITAIVPRTRAIVFMTLEPKVPSDRLENLLNVSVHGVVRMWERLDRDFVRPRLQALLTSAPVANVQSNAGTTE